MFSHISLPVCWRGSQVNKIEHFHVVEGSPCCRSVPNEQVWTGLCDRESPCGRGSHVMGVINLLASGLLAFNWKLFIFVNMHSKMNNFNYKRQINSSAFKSSGVFINIYWRNWSRNPMKTNWMFVYKYWISWFFSFPIEKCSRLLHSIPVQSRIGWKIVSSSSLQVFITKQLSGRSYL